ncbi:MAG: 2-oxo acid dehydrogenase subunit E2 [Candidatus Kapabacteria bacterium]|nr:2-oxo acid dehydrogenase subunit E2 [Candidatus Kapabacteria bacterium]
MIEFTMPSLGADMEDAVLVEWKKHVGEHVQRGDIIAEVETQKGDIEIEVFDTGTITDIRVDPGQRVPVGTVLALIDPDIDVSANGKLSVAKSSADARPKPSAEKFPAATADSIRAAVAAAVTTSNREIPHYYLSTTIDMQPAMAWLHAHNSAVPIELRLLPTVLYIKAIAKALRDVPDLNATWDKGLHHLEHVHVGVVVSLRQVGIIVPTIKDADTKSLDSIMADLNDIIPRARELRLRSSDVGNATITLTSLGEGGVDHVYGVIYPPQVAVIGVGGVRRQPLAVNGSVEVRPVVTITMAGDHRATDGLTGSTFLSNVATYLQHPETL